MMFRVMTLDIVLTRDGIGEMISVDKSWRNIGGQVRNGQFRFQR